jgi:putative endonuclease
VLLTKIVRNDHINITSKEHQSTFGLTIPQPLMHQTPNVGELGEQLVAQWLQTQDWVILHHRWRCRWGEIDLIAQRTLAQQQASHKGQKNNSSLDTLLAFVEVKTRSPRNWDADGLLAITPQKQAKLWQTAQLFLAERPDLANLPSRFDVALVSCQRLSQGSHPHVLDLSPSPTAVGKAIQVQRVQMGKPVLVAGYRLILQDYIQSAFD